LPAFEAVLVLAAGRGTRLGGPKALANITNDGRPWWLVQRERLAGVAARLGEPDRGGPGLTIVWVAGPEVAAALRDPQGASIPDRATHPAAAGDALVAVPRAEGPGTGSGAAPMFHSLHLGLEALERTMPGCSSVAGVFVLPIDVPAPHPGAWLALRDAARGEQTTPPRPTVPTINGRRGHPVYLPWAWAAANVLAPARALGPAADQTLRLDTLIAEAAVAVPVDDPDTLTNLNTPAAVAAWAARSTRSGGA
jgi:CTP:molybdopterin cytidylyltransferase MocA